METYYKERLPHHPLLGRNVNHDPASKGYRIARSVAAQAETLGEVYWPTFADVMDQGQVGSCTGDTGVEAAYAAPVCPNATAVWPTYSRDQDGAYRLYAAATRDDDYAGTWTYPPGGGQDTGSDGLTICKELKKAGVCSGYLWAFTPDEAVGALAKAGVLTGIPWYQSMFDAGPDGQITYRQDSGLAGGHEIYVWGYLPAVGNTPARVKFRNHWGSSWGDHGDGLMWVSDWLELLRQNGDVTQLVPATAPAPTPTPAPGGDERAAGDRLWAATAQWRSENHVGANAKAAKAVKQFGKDTGRS